MVKLEELIKSMVAHKVITSTTGSLSDRAKRKMGKAGKEAYDILKRRKRKTAILGDVEVSLRWSDGQAAWARNLNLAIEEFKQKYKKPGEELDKIIAKHRKVRRAYLEFEGEVSKEFYVEAICDIMKKIPPQEAEQIYNSILIMEKGLKKQKGPNYLILPE